MKCNIEQADCFEFMEDIDSGTIDLLLTDPPYCISKQTGFRNVGKNGVERFAVSMDFGEWDHQEIDLTKLAKLSYSVLRKGGTAIIWYDVWKINYLADALSKANFKMIRLVIWNKTNPVPLNNKACYLNNSREMAVFCVKEGKPTFNSTYDRGEYNFPIPRHGGKKIHPTQKPVKLFSELVRKHSNKGDKVLDPFLGSGTTAVASLENERDFFGCDIDIDYINKVKERINQYEYTE